MLLRFDKIPVDVEFLGLAPLSRQFSFSYNGRCLPARSEMKNICSHSDRACSETIAALCDIREVSSKTLICFWFVRFPQQFAQSRKPLIDIGLRHHSDDLPNMAEVIHYPCREQMTEGHHPQVQDASRASSLIGTRFRFCLSDWSITLGVKART